MKILYILDYYKPSKWWVERVFENIINHFSKENKIIVLTSRFDKKLKKIEKNWNIEIHRIWKWRLLFTLIAFFYWLKFKNVDLIHTSTYNSAYVAKFLSLFSKAKIILTSHEILWQTWYKFKWWKWYFYKKIEDFIYKMWFFYVFVSNHVKNVALTSYWKLDYKVIYNWLEKIKLENLNKQDLWFKNTDILWVFAWRPWRTKWLLFLLKNFEEIRKLNPNFKLLLLLLEKNNSKKIEKIQKYLNNPNIKIIYEIPHDKIFSYLNLADIWIVPSMSEWFWFTALEFSTLWKTMVLSNTGAIPEINFWDCHFFKPNNKESFLTSFKEIFNWKKNNYWYNKLLTVEKMVKNYEEIYKNLWINK